MSFRDRRDAGRQLTVKIDAYANRADVVVLGIPRGGIPVASEVAAALGAPLDICIVRNLGVPGVEELPMGAIASGDVRALNEDVIARRKIPSTAIDEVEAAERQELERRERVYRGDQAPLIVRGSVVILVDDGLATGSTMRAAVRVLRQLEPARIVAGVPVGAADDVVCAETPEEFSAVGEWHDDFTAPSDAAVRGILRHSYESRSLRSPSES